MARIRGILLQWGLLAVGLLGAALLALQGYPGQSKQAIAALPPGSEMYHGAQVYEPGQVVVGVCQHPDLWAERTVLVRADATTLTDLIAGSVPVFSCAAYPGTGDAQLYNAGIRISLLCSRRTPCDLTDPRTDPLNSANRNADGSPAGPLTRIYRTRLVLKGGFGPLAQPNLFGEGAMLVSR